MTKFTFIRIFPASIVLLFHFGCASLTPTQQAERFFLSGQESADRGKFQSARDYYKKALKKDSMYTAAYGGMVEVYLAEERPDLATIFLKSIPRSVATHPEISFFRGLTEARQMRYNEALADLAWALRANYNPTEAAYSMADIHLQLGNYDLAIDLLKPLTGSPKPSQREKIRALMQRASALQEQFLRDSFEGRMLRNLARSPTVKRAHLAFAMVYKLKPDSTANEMLFGDVDPSDSLLPFYSQAVRSGLLESLPDGKFYPNYVVKRRNVAFYLAKILDSSGRSVPHMGHWIDSVQSAVKLPDIPDVPPGDPQHRQIRMSAALGIMTIGNDGQFRPDEAVSGEELLTALRRIQEIQQDMQQ